MKNIIFALLAVLLFNSCASILGPNTLESSRQLVLGMNKQEAIAIMGKDYFVEAASQIPEGKLEILHFRSYYHSDYLLYFINDNLSEFHRYIPPTPLIQHVTNEKSDK